MTPIGLVTSEYLPPLEEIAEDLVHNAPDEEDHRALSDVIRFKQISEMGHR